jgi:Acetoacetate decarboxylase (ADC)
MPTTNCLKVVDTYRCAVSILYRDGSMLVVGNRIDPTRAKASFGGLPLEPLAVWRRALALVCVFEYRDTTIGPYNELGGGVYARRTGRAPSILKVLRDMRPIEEVGLYVNNLPVNTAAAHAAGVELWGFPKYITPIDTAFEPGGVELVVAGEFRLTHSRGRGVQLPGPPFITYTVRAHHLVRTIAEVGHRVRFEGARRSCAASWQGPRRRSGPSLAARCRPTTA